MKEEEKKKKKRKEEQKRKKKKEDNNNHHLNNNSNISSSSNNNNNNNNNNNSNNNNKVKREQKMTTMIKVVAAVTTLAVLVTVVVSVVVLVVKGRLRRQAWSHSLRMTAQSSHLFGQPLVAYLLTYAHSSRWSIGHLRPLVIALCSGLLWSFRTSWSLAVSALLQCLAGLSSSFPAGSRSGLGVWCWMLAS